MLIKASNNSERAVARERREHSLERSWANIGSSRAEDVIHTGQDLPAGHRLTNRLT